VIDGNTPEAWHYLTKALEILDRLGTLMEPDKERRVIQTGTFVFR